MALTKVITRQVMTPLADIRQVKLTRRKPRPWILAFRSLKLGFYRIQILFQIRTQIWIYRLQVFQ